MLQSIRERSQSWIAKIIIAVLVLAMALFGVESLISVFGKSGDEVAKVNGEPITRQQVEQTVQRALRSGQVPPEQERALRGQVLDSLIAERLMASYAEDGGLAISDTQLDQVIVSLPEFHDAQGKFDQDLFRSRLNGAGYSPLTFRAQLRQDLVAQQIQQGLISSDFVLPEEQQYLLGLQRQARTFRYHTLTDADLEQPVTVSEAEQSAYYNEHQQDYLRPEQVKVAYVVLDRQAMAADAKVDDEALRKAWEAQAAEADRRVSHIMVNVGGDRSREQAEAELAEVKQRLEEGESFTDLAAEYSDDAATKDKGGDLGVVVKGIFGEAFDKSAFSLQEGEVSDIVDTGDALHLLKVTQIDHPSFEEAKDELRDQVAQQQIERAFNDKAQQLIDESFAAEDLKSVADDLGLKLEQSDWVARDAGEGVLGEPGVMDQAFSEDVLNNGYNSEVIELDDDRRMVLRVTDHREAMTLPLEQVQERVAEAVRQDKTRDALKEMAAKLAKQLKDGQDLDLSWQAVSNITRQQTSQVPEAIVKTAFQLPHPDEAGSLVYGRAVDGDQVTLIALESVAKGEANEQMEGYVTSMSRRLDAQAMIQGLMEYLRATGDIER